MRGEFERQRLAAGFRATAWSWMGTAGCMPSAADAADAPTLVLVHGFTGSKENWYPLARAAGRPLPAADPGPAGWGESERKPGAVYGFGEQAAHGRVHPRLSPGRPVVLVGHSMGGGSPRWWPRGIRARSPRSRCSTPPGCASGQPVRARRCLPGAIRSRSRTRPACNATSTSCSTTRGPNRGCRGRRPPR